MQNTIKIEGIVTGKIFREEFKSGIPYIKFSIFWADKITNYNCKGYFNCIVIGNKRVELYQNYIKPKTRLVILGAIKPFKYNNETCNHFSYQIGVDEIFYSERQFSYNIKEPLEKNFEQTDDIENSYTKAMLPDKKNEITVEI